LQFVTATAADLVALGHAVQPVYAMLDRDPETRREIVQIQAMRQHTPPEPPASCARTEQTIAEAGPLDGVYQYTVSLGSLRAAGAEPSELNPGNVGATTFVFDRGHFAQTTESPQSCTWEYGKINVTGRRISLLYSAGGGTAGEANSPGELFTLDWSLYRDELTMRRVPGATSPTPFVAEPWRRVSTAPSRSFLSRRCPPPASALPG
jgi:hypothetical protein